MNERDRELAREAGIKMSHDDTLALGYLDNAHKKFVELIRADEREALCKAMEDQNTWNLDDPADTAIQVIRARGDK
jgi:hypothetical protein